MTPPSVWIQSSWRGEYCLDDISKEIKKDLRKEYAGVVGLFALYGSWNTVPADSSGLLRLLDGLLHPQARNDTKYTTGMVKVDSSEEELEVCCGEREGEEQLKLPSPPEQIPVLLLIVKRASMDQPEARFLTLTPATILSYWKLKNKEEVPSEARAEVEHRLCSFGLGGATIPESPQSKQSPAIRIFIAGDRMSVGKTSVSLGLIGSLIRMGYPAESIAYTKPATQNEKPQLVQLYCERLGIECVPVGPIVYYRGFTRAFLAGETESSEELLERVEESVDKLAVGKKILIIDGVGFPAVGSICGTDNAQVARASGYPGTKRRPVGVLLVGGPGVGGAVDAFNLNATYFERAQVPVLGGIFNKLSLDGFYSRENCKIQLTSYFSKNETQVRLGRQAFGFVQLFPGIVGEKAMENVHDFIQIFQEQVNMEAIIEAARKVQEESFPLEMDIDDGETTPVPRPAKRQKKKETDGLSREQIENAAIAAGAAPSA